jgi:hypothetical protein
MFDKQSLDALFDELRNEYELDPDWEDIERAAHLAVAYSDAGLDLKAKRIDSRIISVLEKHRPD